MRAGRCGAPSFTMVLTISLDYHECLFSNQTSVFFNLQGDERYDCEISSKSVIWY